MKTNEIEDILKEAFRRIAPEIDCTTINREADLREAFDIDSMDFLNLITVLSNRLKIKMPETDYPYMMTYNAMIAYLDEHSE